MSIAAIVMLAVVTFIAAHIVHGSLGARRGDVITFLIGAFVFISVVFLLMLLLWGGVHRYDAHRRQVQARAENAAEREALEATISQTRAELGQSTEHLWEKLTEARIELDGETASDEVVDRTDDSESVAEAAVKKQRPAWVDQPPTRVGHVYPRVVSSDRFSTIDECYRQLEQKFVGEVHARLRTLLGDEFSADSPVPVSFDFIMREICREEFTESVDASFGEMQRVHVLMEFTPAVDQQLREAWETDQRQRQSQQRLQRLAGVGSVFGAVLGMLMLIYGLLRFDTSTRGYYSRRLIVAVPVAIILLIVLLTW